LAFGLKFNAKGIVDCYERELESLPFSQKRDIEFKMIEGDFQLFEGKWSIEQVRFC
jgi:ribosome-associated toxin RatA of RatAB toxin-antitoxin module